MAKPRIPTITLVWVASIVLTMLLTQHYTSPSVSSLQDRFGEQAVAPGDRKPRVPAGLELDPKRELARLELENAELREELGQLRTTLDQVGLDYLSYALEQALKGATRRQISQEQVYSTWNKGLEAIDRARERSMFGGLSEGLAFVADVALLGEPGITYMAEVAADTRRSQDEREMALEALALIAHKSALDAIMRVPDPGSFGTDFPYDAIERQLTRLPTADIEEYLPQINRHTTETLSAGQFGRTEARIVATLALVHEDSFSSSLLRDPRIWQENLSDVLGAAYYLHTNQAMEFLEQVSRSHRNEEYRSAAAGILDNW